MLAGLLAPYLDEYGKLPRLRTLQPRVGAPQAVPVRIARPAVLPPRRTGAGASPVVGGVRASGATIETTSPDAGQEERLADLLRPYLSGAGAAGGGVAESATPVDVAPTPTPPVVGVGIGAPAPAGGASVPDASSAGTFADIWKQYEAALGPRPAQRRVQPSGAEAVALGLAAVLSGLGGGGMGAIGRTTTAIGRGVLGAQAGLDEQHRRDLERWQEGHQRLAGFRLEHGLRSAEREQDRRARALDAIRQHLAGESDPTRQEWWLDLYRRIQGGEDIDAVLGDAPGPASGERPAPTYGDLDTRFRGTGWEHVAVPVTAGGIPDPRAVQAALGTLPGYRTSAQQAEAVRRYQDLLRSKLYGALAAGDPARLRRLVPEFAKAGLDWQGELAAMRRRLEREQATGGSNGSTTPTDQIGLAGVIPAGLAGSTQAPATVRRTGQPARDTPPARGTTVAGAPAPRRPPLTRAQREFLERVSPFRWIPEAYGVPAAAMFTQAAHESGWGTSGLATRGHALFGIKAAHIDRKGNFVATWDGPVYSGTTWEMVHGHRVIYYGTGTVYHTAAEALAKVMEDLHVDRASATQTLFRAYPDDPANLYEASIRDYAKFFRENSRYHPCLRAYQYDRDPEGFVRCIHRAGYATDEHYAENVINTMRQNFADLLHMPEVRRRVRGMRPL